MLFPPGLTERVRSSPFLTRVVLGVLTLFALSPFFLTLRPPLQDFPQHLAAGHVLLEPNNPEFRFAEYFESEWLRSQYLGIYLLIGVFYYPFSWFVEQPLLLASRYAIVVLGITWVASGEWLGTRVLRRSGVGLFFLVLFFNAHLILGFLNFLLGTASAFITLALFANLRASRAFPSANDSPIRLRLLFCTSALATFYFHIVPFAMVLAVFLAAFLLDVILPFVLRRFVGRPPRHALTALDYTACVPALLALGAWLFSPAGRSTRNAAQGGDTKVKAVFTSAEANTKAIDSWLMDVFRSEWDTRWMYLALGALGLYIVLEWLGRWFERGHLRRKKESQPGGPTQQPAVDTVLVWLLRCGAPACAVAYYTTPASYDWIWPINARFPLLALLLLPFWLPVSTGASAKSRWLSLTRRVTFAACTLLWAGAAVGETLLARDAFKGFTKETAGLDDILDAIPKGQKVATLVFDRGSRYVAFSPFLHVGAYYQAERGGVSYFSFNDFPQSPVRFLPDDRPPKAKPRWEWRPEAVKPDDELVWFDYLIVRGGPTNLRASRHFSEQLNVGRFRLFKNTRHSDDD